MDVEQVNVTPRDQQVFSLLVEGCSNQEIAGPLNISLRTVQQHQRRLFLRAGIRDGRQRVKLAMAILDKEGLQSGCPASAFHRKKFRSRFSSGKD